MILLFLWFVLFRDINGMESAFLVFFLITYLYYGWEKYIRTTHNLGAGFWFGFLLGLLTISRLNMIFIVFSFFAFWLCKFYVERIQRLKNFGIGLCGFSAKIEQS